MKFLLKETFNQKYILNEAKFILDERFILTEDKEAELARFDTEYKKINATINKIMAQTDVLKDLDNEIQEIAKNRQAKVDYKIIQGDIKAFLDKFKNYYNSIDKTAIANYSIFTQQINRLEDEVEEDKSKLAGGSGATVFAYDQMLKDYDALITTIKTVFSQTNAPLDGQDLLKQKEELTTLKDNNREWSENTAKVAADELTKLNSIQINTLIDYKNNVFDALNVLINKITDLAKNDKTEAEDAELQDIANNYTNEPEWAEAFKQVGLGQTVKIKKKKINNVEDLWTLYYETEWKKYDSNKLKSLGEAFVIELQELGYTERNNAFITFLKMPGMLQTVTKGSYAGLHNAYVEEFITADDLRGKDGAITYNIIYNKNLYKLSGGEVENYLKTQKELMKDAKDITNIKIDALKTRYSTKNGEKQLSLDIFTSNPIAAKASYVPGTNQSKLNSIAKVTELRTRVFSDVTNKIEFNLSDDLKQQLQNNIPLATKLINLFIICFAGNKSTAEVNKILDNFKKYDKQLQFNDTAKAAEYRQFFEKKFDMKKDFAKAIDAIAEAAGIEKINK